MVEIQILNALTTGSPLTNAGNRVYSQVLPEGLTQPSISFQRVSTSPINDLSGHADLDYVRMQVDCWANTYGAAKILAGQVRSILTDRTLPFKALLDNERDDFDPETETYRVSSDYFVWQID